MKQPALISKDGTEIRWVEAIIASMEGLGHPATIREIKEYMADHIVVEFPDSANTPYNTIAGEIYVHTEDSSAGVENEHFFKCFRRGVWGLSAWADDFTSNEGD